MALYVGDGVSIVVDVVDPVRQVAITNLDGVQVVLDFFAPGKDPRGNPEDRETPDVSGTSATYDPTAITKNGVGAWVVYQPTSVNPWVAGKWAYRVTVSGAYQNVEYGSFTLKP